MAHWPIGALPSPGTDLDQLWATSHPDPQKNFKSTLQGDESQSRLWLPSDMKQMKESLFSNYMYCQTLIDGYIWPSLQASPVDKSTCLHKLSKPFQKQQSAEWTDQVMKAAISQCHVQYAYNYCAILHLLQNTSTQNIECLFQHKVVITGRNCKLLYLFMSVCLLVVFHQLVHSFGQNTDKYSLPG